MRKILEKIKEFNTIIIHSHIRPDGDAIGSQYGLMYLIKDSFPDKNVYVSGDYSDYVSFLGKPNLIDECLFKNSLSICLDCAIDERLSDYSIKIDHHIKDKVYCDYEYIDDNAASCAEIIVEFYEKFKDELIMSKDCANALYVGILTDTGHFRYDSVSSKTFKMASILLENGVNLGKIDTLLSSETLELLKLKGYGLNNFKITVNGFAYIILYKNIIEEYNVNYEDAATLVNLISNIKDIPVWAIILETDREIRIRLRSKGPSINTLAGKYNGGGHKMASGAKLKSWNELDNFIFDVDKLVKEYKETLQK